MGFTTEGEENLATLAGRFTSANPGAVNLPGAPVTLLESVAVTANGTTYGVGGDAGVTGLDIYALLTGKLKVSAKNLAGGGTVNVYLQRPVDDDWDDVRAFTQITNAAVANGSYVFQHNAAAIATDLAAARLVTDGSLTAGTARDVDWTHGLRVKIVADSFGLGDTVTLALPVYLK